MIKTTSLIVMIGVVEVLKVGQQIIEANIYSTGCCTMDLWSDILLYFIVCYPISKAATILEKNGHLINKVGVDILDNNIL